MARVSTGMCTYCQRHRIALSGKGKRFKLCRQCSSNRFIIGEKIHAEQVTKEIRAGLPKLYKELRNEANNEK